MKYYAVNKRKNCMTVRNNYKQKHGEKIMRKIHKRRYKGPENINKCLTSE